MVSAPTCALCLMNYALKSGAGVPPTTLHSSLFTIHCVKVSFTLTPHEFLLFTHNKWKKPGGRVPYGIGALFLSDEQCSSLRIERSDTGVPEKYCAANFLGRGETNVANLKGLLANLFLLRNLFGRAGVPPSISTESAASLGDLSPTSFFISGETATSFCGQRPQLSRPSLFSFLSSLLSSVSEINKNLAE